MKFTNETEGSASFLVCELENGEKIDKLAMGMLENNDIPGLLPVSFSQLDDRRFLKFQITSRVSLEVLLSRGMNRERVLNLLTSFCDTFAGTEEYLLENGKILLDRNRIYCDISTGKAYFIYLPVERETKEPDLGGIVREILNSSKYDASESSGYIASLLNYVNQNDHLDPEKFGKFLAEMRGGEVGGSGAEKVPGASTAGSAAGAERGRTAGYAPSPARSGEAGSVGYQGGQTQNRQFGAAQGGVQAGNYGGASVSRQPGDVQARGFGGGPLNRQPGAAEAGNAGRAGYNRQYGAPAGTNSPVQPGNVVPEGRRVEQAAQVSHQFGDKAGAARPGSASGMRQEITKKQFMPDGTPMPRQGGKEQPEEKKEKKGFLHFGKKKDKEAAPTQGANGRAPLKGQAVSGSNPYVGGQASGQYGGRPAPQNAGAPAGQVRNPYAGSRMQGAGSYAGNRPAQGTNVPAGQVQSQYAGGRMQGAGSYAGNRPAQGTNVPAGQVQNQYADGRMQGAGSYAGNRSVQGTPAYQGAGSQAGQAGAPYAGGQMQGPGMYAGAEDGSEPGTTLLTADMIGSGTTLLSSDMAKGQVYRPTATLKREKTGEVITINKDEFMIGKSRKYTDYFVSDNAAISRSHCSILHRDGQYYVEDMNSLNHTYLNGELLTAGEEKPLRSGDTIMLADERFDFQVR